jgi:glycerol-3-phosphate dehydrogenase subunit C
MPRSAGGAKVLAIADEDLERENEEKTSSVHFLRFELDPGMREKLHAGAALTIGVDHPQYCASLTVPEEVRASLMADLQKH